MKIVTVLRSGGDFQIGHVQALQRQVAKHAPFAEFVCLSDVEIPGVGTVALNAGWLGWWAKMQMFRPDIEGDFLYMDLDTVIVDSLSDILAVDELTLLRDFYRDGVRLKKGLQSSLMYIPESYRANVWKVFAPRANEIIKTHPGGDQQFLEKVWGVDVPTWQEVLPRQVVSYKVHCAVNVLGRGPVFSNIPLGARVICHHGKPRPWHVEKFKDLYT